jgi:threonyl-tRNA synthetase
MSEACSSTNDDHDHRAIGTRQDLFFFHHYSPGSGFFTPHGTRVYSSLVSYVRDLYWKYEYDEVITPNIFNFDLWEVSGHAAHYRANMFQLDVEGNAFGLKPMNCPSHCLMYANRVRSYRDLPIRYADFGALHRNEFSGALSGLTRLRRFQQDDAHVFCRPDQVRQEVLTFLKMLREAYGILNLSFAVKLSTRPVSFLGTVEQWERAEEDLAAALEDANIPYAMNPGDGAFYGPKIDVTVVDAQGRRFQCATGQLDFQLPERFDLKYVTSDTESLFARPVILHRAILGSVERMFALLAENYGGKWPLWLSPRQVAVLPVSERALEYAENVRRALRTAGLHASVDASARSVQKKVREAQLEQTNYIQS